MAPPRCSDRLLSEVVPGDAMSKVDRLNRAQAEIDKLHREVAAGDPDADLKALKLLLDSVDDAIAEARRLAASIDRRR